MVQIREEMPTDHRDVYEVNSQAYETDEEAKLVNALRHLARPFLSLVAVVDDKLVGHIAFTPVTIGLAASGSKMMGLAPMAVAPAHQKQGVGTALVRAGLEECAKLGTELVFVLGHPTYYPRFGFIPAAPLGLHYSDYKLDKYFFVLELVEGALEGVKGDVIYHPRFYPPG